MTEQKAAADSPPRTSFSLLWFGIALGAMVVLRGGIEGYAAICNHFGAPVAMGVGYVVFTPFCYFLVGLLVGWKSDQRTYFEPALAALILAAPTTLAVLLFRAHFPEGLYLCGCDGIFQFFLTLIGAMIGERVQGR